LLFEFRHSEVLRGDACVVIGIEVFFLFLIDFLLLLFVEMGHLLLQEPLDVFVFLFFVLLFMLLVVLLKGFDRLLFSKDFIGEVMRLMLILIAFVGV
jgi:hypothetical protein